METTDEYKDINEAIEDTKEEKKMELPEAPVSITLKGYYKGFSVLITKRNAEGLVKIDEIVAAVDNLMAKGFMPSWNDETNQKVAPTKPAVDQNTCPHKNVTIKVSSGHNKPENKGKAYKACFDCGKFLEWVVKEGFEKDMETA